MVYIETEGRGEGLPLTIEICTAIQDCRASCFSRIMLPFHLATNIIGGLWPCLSITLYAPEYFGATYLSVCVQRYYNILCISEGKVEGEADN